MTDKKKIGVLPVRGRGGGSKGGGAQNDVNTLRSNARARLIEAISEGPIHGLVNGEKSIFFDQTPLQNADNSYNFKEVVWQQHVGLADEGFFNGHAAVETPSNVEVQVKKTTGPVQRTILDENVDAIRVIIRIPALVFQEDNGLKKTNLSYAIDVRASGGSWVTALTKDLINEKALSPFQLAHRIDLPTGGSPWDVRVRRITDDSTNDKLQNDLYWESYISLVEGKFIYPFTAAVAMEVNAEEMGSSIPRRSYHVKGLLVKVPTNYDPIARTYAGIWNGTFKTEWTNNPAWIFYDLLTNNRYGLGEFVKPEIVDKWSLYAIAQYCDELVPSGFKNTVSGLMIMEPRFTYNGVINTRDEAFFVLQSITQAWRGMAYWALGKVFATADMPTDPVRLVSPANVIGGDFEYSGTALKSRHSVVQVKWNDPEDFYRQATEIIIDTDLLNKYGWREKSVQLRGCTSRGLAHRYGKWIIDTEQYETDTLTYTASWDHAELRPGDIIAVSDPRKALARAGGRIVSHSGLVVELDAPFEATIGPAYNLMLTLPNGSIETRGIASFLDSQTVQIASAYTVEALSGAMWAITGVDITPRNYRVITVDEAEPHLFKITSLFHDPLKYARIEQNILFEPLPYTRVLPAPEKVTGVAVSEEGYVLAGKTINALTVSWTPPVSALYRGFIVSVDTPNNGRVSLGPTNSAYMTLDNTEGGEYTFYVQTISQSGVVSESVSFLYNATGPTGFTMPTVTNLQLAEDSVGSSFAGRDVAIRWKNNFAAVLDGTVDNASSPHYTFNTVNIFDTGTNSLMRSERVIGEHYVYSYLNNKADALALALPNASRSLRFEVTVFDIFDRTSTVTARTFTNSKPGTLTPAFNVNDGVAYISWARPTDDDYAGTILFFSENPGINILTDTPYYDGVANSVTIPAQPNTDYYFKLAAYDSFGKNDLNWSPEYTVTTDSRIIGNLAIEISNLAQDVRDAISSWQPRFRELAQNVERVAHDSAIGAGKSLIEQSVVKRTQNALAVALSQLSAEVTEVNGVTTALASAITQVEASVDDLAAGGLISFEAQVPPNAGTLATIRIMVRASTLDSFIQSGLNIEVYDDDPGAGVLLKSRVTILADQFVVTDGSQSSTPLVFESGVLKSLIARFGNATFDEWQSSNGKLVMKGSGTNASLEIFS